MANAEKNESPTAISWEALEYPYYRKSSDWFWAVGILTLGFMGVAFITKNFLFAIFITLAGFTLALMGAKPPRRVIFSLTPHGIQVDTRLYPYTTLKSFWIFYEPSGIKELSVESQKLMMPHIKIPLGDTNPTHVRQYLVRFMPEKLQEESLVDTAARYLKF